MSGKDLRIIYMGTPDFAVEPLRRLIEGGYNVVCVITAVDKPAGRGLKDQKSAVKQYAEERGIPILQPEKLRDEAFLEELSSYKPDLGIVIAFRMLPKAVWDMPRLGTFNLHASLLPQYRGAAPINRAIMNGEKITGVTTFMLNEEIDKGDIIAQRKVEIGDNESAGELHDRLMEAGAGLVLESVETVAGGKFSPLGQSEIESGELKPAPKIFKEDCRIEWGRSCDEIFNHIRGLSPYPAAWSEMRGEEDENPISIKIFCAAKEISSHGKTYGEIVSDGKNYLKVACNDGYISILELQAAGKRRMSTGDFLRGSKNIEKAAFV